MEVVSYFLRTYTTRIKSLNRTNCQENLNKSTNGPTRRANCLPWFLVNNRWFKISYFQDQPVNLWDIFCLLFSRK